MDDLPQLYFIPGRFVMNFREVTFGISKLIDPHFIRTWEYSDDVETCGKMKCESLPVQVSRESRSQTIMNGDYGMQSTQ